MTKMNQLLSPSVTAPARPRPRRGVRPKVVTGHNDRLATVHGAEHGRTVDQLCRDLGVSHTTISRTMQENGLGPDLTVSFHDRGYVYVLLPATVRALVSCLAYPSKRSQRRVVQAARRYLRRMDVIEEMSLRPEEVN